MNMNRKIFCLMLLIGMIFSVSSVCAADLNDTPVIHGDNFIKNDINQDINCNDNSTDNSTEIDNFDNKSEIDINNIGVLPSAIIYDMEPFIIKESSNHEINDYFINFTFVKSSQVKSFSIHFEIDEIKDWYVNVADSLNQASRPLLVVSDHEISQYYLSDFNEITVTLSYILNDIMEFSKVTFEKSDFLSNLYMYR